MRGIVKKSIIEWREYIEAIIKELYAEGKIESPVLHPNHMLAILEFVENSPLLRELVKENIYLIVTTKSVKRHQSP